MQQRFPGFGCVLSISAVLFGAGCSARVPSPKSAAGQPGSPMSPEMAPRAAMADASAAALESAPAAPPPPSAVPRTGEQPAPTPLGAAISPNREMLDIEANVTLQVTKVKRALKALHDLTTQVGGVITEERVDTASQYGSAQLTLRVPSNATQSVFEAMEGLGSVLDQNVTARDIGKDYFDANLRLASLETTLHRYEEILTRAANVEDMLRIEQELGRLRAEIEQTKGNLRWLSDRAARATLHVTLREQAPELAHAVEPEAQFFPSVRLPALVDFGKRETQGYFGAGFALHFSRTVSLDLDVLERPDSDRRGPDSILASIGGEVYSALLGGGQRRYLNPYLGWRAGYARFDADNQAMLGATLGLELYKNRWFGVDIEARNYLAFGSARGAHYLLTPALAARVAF